MSKVQREPATTWSLKFFTYIQQWGHTVHGSRAGHATTLPQQRDNVFRPPKWDRLFSICCDYKVFQADTETCFNIFRIFRVTKAIYYVDALSLSLTIVAGPALHGSYSTLRRTAVISTRYHSKSLQTLLNLKILKV